MSDCNSCESANQFGNMGDFNSQAGSTGGNNHMAPMAQNMNSKSFEDCNAGGGVANSKMAGINTGNNNNNNNNTNQPQQQHQDFSLDDLNFDPAALIEGNGESTDLNVSYYKCKYIQQIA